MPINLNGYIINSTLAKTLNYKDINTNGLIWNMDASALESMPQTGNKWFDMSGTNSYATLYGGASYSNESIRLDGSNDYISLPTAGFAPPEHTIEFWIKCHEYKGAHFFVVDASDNPELRLSINTSKVVVTWYDDSAYIASFNSSANISLDTWYNISFTTKNNDFRLYINGTLDTADTSGTYTGGTSGNAGEHTLGTYNRPGTGYNGYANVSYSVYRFYNRVLSASEILTNYNIQKKRFGL